MSRIQYLKLSNENTPPSFENFGDNEFVMDTRMCGGKILRALKGNETQGVPQSVEIAAVDLIM